MSPVGTRYPCYRRRHASSIGSYQRIRGSLVWTPSVSTRHVAPPPGPIHRPPTRVDTVDFPPIRGRIFTGHKQHLRRHRQPALAINMLRDVERRPILFTVPSVPRLGSVDRLSKRTRLLPYRPDQQGANVVRNMFAHPGKECITLRVFDERVVVNGAVTVTVTICQWAIKET